MCFLEFMALVTMKELLDRAEEQGVAVGAFSVGNMEMVMGAVKAAEELETPIILQIAEVRLPHSPLELMGPMMLAAAENAAVDIAVHLDHGLHPETVAKALDIGFTSVMFDGSQLPLEKNIEIVKNIVHLASDYDATVEAELGVVGGNEGEGKAHEVLCTNPADAVCTGERASPPKCSGSVFLWAFAKSTSPPPRLTASRNTQKRIAIINRKSPTILNFPPVKSKASIKTLKNTLKYLI